jgi:hypothetical protein
LPATDLAVTVDRRFGGGLFHKLKAAGQIHSVEMLDGKPVLGSLGTPEIARDPPGVAWRYAASRWNVVLSNEVLSVRGRA